MKDKNQHMSATSSQAEEIFFAALEFDTINEQKDFVQEACMGDRELLRETDLLFDSLAAAEVLFADDRPMWITAEDLVDTISNLPEFLEYRKSNPSDDVIKM